MKNNDTQQNTTNSTFQAVLEHLKSAPDTTLVSSSFEEAMGIVTDASFDRIPSAAKKDVSSLSLQSIMTNCTKTFVLAVPALAVVLLIGYNTIGQNSLGQYEDIMLAVLEEEGAYQYADYDINYDDILEEIELEEDIHNVPKNMQSLEDSAPPVSQSSSDTYEPVAEESVAEIQQAEKELDEALLAIENIFLEDDIDDTELSTWFADNSASDELFESYDI